MWRLIEPLLPAAKPGGRRRTTDLRAVIDAILDKQATTASWAQARTSDKPVVAALPQFVFPRGRCG